MGELFFKLTCNAIKDLMLLIRDAPMYRAFIFALADCLKTADYILSQESAEKRVRLLLKLFVKKMSY